MADPAIGSNVHQSLDIHCDLGAQRALDAIIALDSLSQPIHIGVIEIAYAQVRAHASRLQNLARRGAADSEDVRETHFDLLITREVNASNSSHSLALPLLMLGIPLADDARDTGPFHYSTVLTDRLNAAANFHRVAPLITKVISAKTLRLTGLDPLCKGVG